MPIVEVDIAAAVAQNRESIFGVLTPVAGALASNAFSLNQDVVGIAIAPTSAYDRVIVQGLVSGSSGNSELVVGAPLIAENLGVLPDATLALGPTGQLRMIDGYVPSADILNPDALVSSALICQFFMVPPKQPPLVRGPMRTLNPANASLGAGAATVDIMRIPAPGRRSWMVAVRFATPANVTAVNIYGRLYTNLGVALGSDRELATAAPDANGFVLFQLDNLDFTCCRVEVEKTDDSVYQVFYSLV